MMFGGMCGGWKAKKSYEKYRKELEESPRTRRRLLQANIGVDDSDAENVDDFVHHDPLTTEILLDFAPVSDTEGRELAVKKGDIVRVLYRTGEWLYVSKKLGSEGYVPAGYCRAYAAPAVIEQFDEEKKRLRQQTATNAAKSGPKPKKFEKGDRVEALYNFRAEERDDLSISRGDRLVVVDEQDHDWVWVRNGAGNEGCVPATYVVSCGPPPPPPRVKIDRPDRENDDVRNLLTNVKAKLQTVDPSRRHFPHKQLPHQNYPQRSRSVEDTRARGKSPTPQPTDDRPQQQQQQQQPTRRFPPKLQPSNLAPISESGARRNGSPAPTSGGARRPKQQFHSTRLAESGGYLNRSHSFNTVATAPPPSSYHRATRRHLETRLLESSDLRPSDFSFDNINQLLNVADGKRPSTTTTGTLNAKLYEHRDGSGSAAASSSSNPSPTHSTISADSSGACSTTSRKLDYNRMQIEARLRLSHSRLGIHSSQSSIPIVSTTAPVASQRLHVQREQDNSWSYSTP